MQKKTLQKTLSGSAKKSRQTTGEESRRSAQQSTQSGGARATYTSLPTKEKAEYVRDLTERYYRSQRAAETAARRTESAVRSGGAGSSTHYGSSGRAHGGSSGSFGTALGYGEAIGGGIEAGLWNGAVAGPLNLVASKVGQKISSSDTDTWLGKTSFQKEHEITAAFLGRLGSVWDGYELGDGSFSQKLKDTAFAGYNSAFQNFLEGAGRRPGLFPGGESREALYLGSNALFHALKEYALPAITGSHDKEYNARWLTGKAYEAVDKLTDKASSVPGRKYFNSKIYQKDLEASSPSVRLAGKVSQSVANMLPSIAVSLATESPDAALLALSASAAGNAAKEAYESGATPEQAYYIGLEKGYVEYLTAGMFDALGVFGGGKLTPGMKSLLGEYASSKGGRGLIKVGGILGENVEEGVSDWSETGIERAVLGHTIGGKEDKTLAQALAGQAPWTEDGLVTLLSTLALNGGEQITNRLQSSVDKAASAKQQANEAAYLRRMEEIGHLRPEGDKNAALDGAAEDVQEDITEQKSGGLQRTEKSDIMSFRMAETGGRRNETPLTSDQIAAAEQMARSQGYEGDIAYSEHENTAFIGFSDGTRLLIIGTDAYPSETPRNANEALPIKAAIAHETVGHYEAWLRGSVKENRVLDEVQASVRAARFAADLTIEERDALMQDAFFRLKKANLSFEEIKDQLDIEER